MQNLFYVPPHQPQETHPKPVGVRTIVKRNQPTRLDLSAQVHPSVVEAGLITMGDIAAETERSGWPPLFKRPFTRRDVWVIKRM